MSKSFIKAKFEITKRFVVRGHSKIRDKIGGREGSSDLTQNVTVG